MSTKPDRLYGVPGAEQLHLDMSDAYELQIDPYFPDDWEEVWSQTERSIEEWTVQPASNHLPTVDVVLDWIIECAAEELIDESWFDHCERAGRLPDVVEAFDEARTLLASKIKYWMADKLVASHMVTWSDPDTPLVNGQPLYHPTKPPVNTGDRP